MDTKATRMTQLHMSQISNKNNKQDTLISGQVTIITITIIIIEGEEIIITAIIPQINMATIVEEAIEVTQTTLGVDVTEKLTDFKFLRFYFK